LIFVSHMTIYVLNPTNRFDRFANVTNIFITDCACVLHFIVQLELDFRLHFPEAVTKLINDFPLLTPGIIAAARLSPKCNVVDLLKDYDTQQHASDLNTRDYTYGILALLHLLPSSNTRQKGKLSSAEFESSLVAFKPQQTSIALFVDAKKSSTNKQPSLLCIGSKDEPGPFYLILDAKAVSLGDCGTLRALDSLFKVHFVYWVTYAKCLGLFMEFLQKVVYKIENRKMSSRVQELHTCIQSVASAAN